MTCKKWICLFAALILAVLPALCEPTAEPVEAEPEDALARARELIVGSWDFMPEGANYKIRYTFTAEGLITQQAWGYDDKGNEIDLSLDAFGMTYELIDAANLALIGAVTDVTAPPEIVHYEFPDENTMILGESAYQRASE